MRLKNILALLILYTFVFGQDYDPNHFLVELKPDMSIATYAQILDTQHYKIEKVVVKRLKILLIKCVSPQANVVSSVTEFRSDPWVKHAQLDHYVHQRSVYPNDPQFGDMWDLENTGQSGGTEDADIDAPEAWDFGTGGLNALGDTIVVAVVDGGAQVTHPDLAQNIWTNRNEIPGNGIDDDENGYVDDVHGWNAYSSNGSIPVDYHGTHVSGTIGAVGDNDLNVTGINWNIKIMEVAGSTSQTSVALEAYGYVLDQRALYDSTDGEKGAFVVATNSSFGVDYADCSTGSYPLWNDIYTAMGEVGILSAAATINAGQNVDVIGDVPTGCDSDYLVTVTNTTRYDSKNSSAGYGATTIDLGAPGTATLSLNSSGGTGVLTGTSMATPHVCGTVGFLHSIATAGFEAFYKANPGEGALILKQFILDGVDTIPDLENTTVSGGRLNLYNTSAMVVNYMGADSTDPNPVTNLAADTSHWYQTTLTWTDPTTTFGGDTLPEFQIDISRDDSLIAIVSSGTEYFQDFRLVGGQTYRYSVVSRIVESHAVSIPATISVTISGGDCMPGDVSLDGQVDLIDILYEFQYVLQVQSIPPAVTCQADVDFDGDVTIFDLLSVADMVSGY